MTKAICLICGRQCDTITTQHLKRHGLTLQQYTELYPDAKLMSDEYQAKRLEIGRKVNGNRRGIKRSEETKEKIRQTKKNDPQPAWNKGIPMTEDRKAHLSAIRRERFKTGEITHWNTNGVTSEETKEKIRQTALSQKRQYSPISKDRRAETLRLKKDNGWIHHKTKRFVNKMSDENLAKFNSKDWLYEQHITNKRTISSIAVELGLHWYHSSKTVRKQLTDFDIPIHYYHQASSQQQADVERYLDTLGITFTTRNRSIIAPLELDIVIESHKIAIEYCGLYWHSSEYKETSYHKDKFDDCAAAGYRLITIFSDEWLNCSELVKNKLASLLGKTTEPVLNARDCVVIEISNQQRQKFLDAYHIQGDGPGSTTYGLHHNGQLVAVTTWIDKGAGVFVMNRYAAYPRVRGGFSKMLAHFKRNHQWKEIVTFADQRWSVGDLYRSTGFELDKILPPDFEYVINEQRIHKFNWRKSTMQNRLDDYDEELSETENMTKAGIHRIYNCGLQRWVMKNTESPAST